MGTDGYMNAVLPPLSFRMSSLLIKDDHPMDRAGKKRNKGNLALTMLAPLYCFPFKQKGTLL